MFRRTMRIYRRGFVWTTLLLCLMMTAAGLLNPLTGALAPLLAEEEIALPNMPNTLLLTMRCGLGYELIGALYAAMLGMRTLRREAKPGTLMWNLPVSRAQVVLRHYLAGATYVLAMAALVGAASFGALSASGRIGAEAILPLMHPALGFLAIYSVMFGLASVIHSGAVLGAASVLLPVVLLLPTFAMMLRAFSTLALPSELALFLPYGVTDMPQMKTAVGAGLAIALPLLLSLAVYNRRSLI